MILVRKWMVQAEADLSAAKDSCISKHYNWSCFQAQQSAEKALKAYLYSKGYTSVITHSIKELLRECEKIEKEDAKKCLNSAESILNNVRKFSKI
jgi:HEPN domain-containing protein